MWSDESAWKRPNNDANGEICDNTKKVIQVVMKYLTRFYWI